MDIIVQYIHFEDPNLRYAALVIALCPIIWNILARLEFYTHILTKIAFGNRYIGCYLLATWIFFFSLYRDYLFSQAILTQPKLPFFEERQEIFKYAGYSLICLGGILVLSSMYQLGITGTYLGDYFGILMDNMVVSFPFNIVNNPMYDGATLCFLGQSLVGYCPAAILLTLEVFIVYRIALQFEEPFTHYIYSQRNKGAKAEVVSKKKSKKIE